VKARLLDKVALSAISPTALRAYVVYEGWQRLESFGHFSEVYVRSDNGRKNELVIPASTEIADYASAIGDAIRFISKFEDRDEIAIYGDLTRADRDVVRVRAPEAADDGSIVVDHGVEIVQRARDLLASGACAALDPRRAYHLGKVQQAEDYMRRVRLGQTEHGSFIVTLLTPMPPALSYSRQEMFWPHLEDEPYERKVTRILVQGLHAARRAIVESARGDDGMSAFTEAVPQGVSANLCESVASIIDQAEGAEISVTWAKTRPAPKARDNIIFGRADGEILKEAARQFRLREPRHDVRIIGYVRHLYRPEDQVEGRVNINGLVDGRARSLTVDLSRVDYEVAVDAHARQLPVTLVGDLENEGQRLRLREPRDIRIVESGDDE
jgi:hypothetical protein